MVHYDNIMICIRFIAGLSFFLSKIVTSILFINITNSLKLIVEVQFKNLSYIDFRLLIIQLYMCASFYFLMSELTDCYCRIK
jgi:hypothetical protein